MESADQPETTTMEEPQTPIPDAAPTQDTADNKQTEESTPATNGEETETAKEASLFSFGIDLGCTKSCFALDDDLIDIPLVVQNELSNSSTPSYISFLGHDRRIGEQASSMITSHPKNSLSMLKPLCISNAKSTIVKNLTDTSCMKFVDKQSSLNPNGVAVEVRFEDETHVFEVPQLIAMLFGKFYYCLKVHSRHGHVVNNPDHYKTLRCAVAVSAAFLDESLQSLQSIAIAAQIANLPFSGFVDSLSASAISLALHHHKSMFPPSNDEEAGKEKTEEADAEEGKEVERTSVLGAIVDAGHFSLKAGIYRFWSDGEIELVHRQHCGGTAGARDIDLVILEVARQHFKSKHKTDITSRGETAKAYARVLKESSKVKHILSTVPKTTMHIDYLFNDTDLHLEVTRQEMESSIQPILNNIRQLLTKLLSSCEEKLSFVELIGGGSRVPSVKNVIQQVFSGITVGFRLDSEHCIAEGTAYWANMDRKSAKFRLTDPLNDSQKKLFKSDNNESGSLFQLELNPEQSALLETYQNTQIKLIEHDIYRSKRERVMNEIETFVYEMKDKLLETSYKDYFSADECDKATQLLDEFRQYLEESVTDETPLDQLESKRAELHQQFEDTVPRFVAYLDEEAENKKKQFEKEKMEAELRAKSNANKPKQLKTNKQRIEFALKKKGQGNALHQELDYAGAINQWATGLSALRDIASPTDEEKAKGEELQLALHSNISAAALKLKKYQQAKDNCSDVLKLNDKNVKAMYRRAQAFYGLKQFDNALKDLKAAKKLAPQDKAVTKLTAVVEKALEEQKKKEKSMFAKMFGK